MSWAEEELARMMRESAAEALEAAALFFDGHAEQTFEGSAVAAALRMLGGKHRAATLTDEPAGSKTVRH